VGLTKIVFQTCVFHLLSTYKIKKTNLALGQTRLYRTDLIKRFRGGKLVKRVFFFLVFDARPK
jgi:hypothetical protein